MARHHGQHGYGPAMRFLHWLVAALIVAVALRGLTMVRLPASTEAEAAGVFAAYSVHKTAGLAALALILLRLVARLLTSGPGPLHPERKVELFLARLTHLTLWGAMILLPLSGWLRHASAPGIAPILWPFGQHLPGIPADESFSRLMQTFHRLAGWVLAAALALHLLGTLKHLIVDRDTTMARMTTGRGPYAPPAGGAWIPALAALGLWMLVALVALRTAPTPEPDPFEAIPEGFAPLSDPAPETAPPAASIPPPDAVPAPDDAAEPSEPIDMPPPPAD
ncbi:cytochrome b [Albidovulum sediminis]|uniref:Cytochrome b/b6 domain-containing protein n=1 Tax=Albidovulum sediminis TaxID=3066345 RepID=A0ABT2NJY8_9RHOB|nr:cytochrome b/b6 domain-containing protein [Defluviimonas sediminis]MCT8329243.1 cytochrome b/b6 domain-containing protein [Defluviimonas sediminis]